MLAITVHVRARLLFVTAAKHVRVDPAFVRRPALIRKRTGLPSMPLADALPEPVPLFLIARLHKVVAAVFGRLTARLAQHLLARDVLVPEPQTRTSNVTVQMRVLSTRAI